MTSKQMTELTRLRRFDRIKELEQKLRETEEWSRKRAADIITLGARVGELEAVIDKCRQGCAVADECRARGERINELEALLRAIMPDIEDYGVVRLIRDALEGKK